MGNYVITIGREFESLGRDVGLKLSETLGIKCYDKESQPYGLTTGSAGGLDKPLQGIFRCRL